ncbi:MAG: RNA polymerase sigma factor [Bacteroidetes bacterium]|nr:RNA polymerase sigma factor [Bacteroidota bacterium]
MTDRELKEGIISKDGDAIRYLVDKYQEKVVRTAYRYTGNMEDAEDLSQEIFLEILRSAERFRDESSISTWIYRITVNYSLNAVKRKNGFLKFFSGSRLQETDEPNDIRDFLGEEENVKLIYSSISALPARQKTAFILHRFEDLSYKEISEVMKVSLSSVESLIHRARMNLYGKLAGHFSEYIK